MKKFIIGVVGLVAVLGIMLVQSSPVSSAIVVGDFTTETTPAATSITIDKPANVANGDLLLAQVVWEKGADVTVTAPTGWNHVITTYSENPVNGTELGQAVYYKVITDAASEPASYQWGFSQEAYGAGGIIRLTGVDTTAPIMGSAGDGGDETPATAPSVTSEAGALLVSFFSLKEITDNGPALSTPAGMSQLYQVDQSNGEVTIAAFTETLTGNPSGTRSSNLDPEADWIAQNIALRAAAEDGEATLTITKFCIDTLEGEFEFFIEELDESDQVVDSFTTDPIDCDDEPLVIPLSPGTYQITELGVDPTDLIDYTTLAECFLNDDSTPLFTDPGVGPHTIEIEEDDEIDCRFDNDFVGHGTLTIVKDCPAAGDTGVFDFEIEHVNNGLEPATVIEDVACDTTSDPVDLTSGTYSITELAGNLGTDLANYETAISCVTGEEDPEGASGVTIQISIGDEEDWTCTFTNRRTAEPVTGTLTLNKICVGLDEGEFIITVVNGATENFPLGCGDSVGPVDIGAGTWRVFEADPDPGIVPTVECTVEGTPVDPDEFVVGADEEVVCTITNASEEFGQITVSKVCTPDADDPTGSFEITLLHSEGPAAASQTIGCGESAVFAGLDPLLGYHAEEEILAGDFELATTTCGTPEARLTVVAGADTPCIITNAASDIGGEGPFDLTVSKVCVGVTGTFSFNADGQVFSLPCMGQTTLEDLGEGNILISETSVPAGEDIVTFIICTGDLVSIQATSRVINLDEDFECIFLNFSEDEAPEQPPTLEQIFIIINNILNNKNDNENENENENENDNENNNTNISENNNTNTNTNTQNQTNNQTQVNDNNQVTNVTSSPNQSQNVNIKP